MLEGYDQTWSEWSDKTVKDYSLAEGSYTFHVKAKNILDEESSVVSYSFEVLPPWFRTWWAYIIFVIAFLGLIALVVRLSIRRVKLQNIRLEKIVEERTEEVVAQKAEAEKQRDFAEEQKHLVEEKNAEITDSINYAKRLQTAILTPIKNIQETFSKSFILYLPKDIVAGDFYWTNLAKQNNRNSRSLIAAADCTGHGVPGAMVSVVCSNALDRSVKEFGLIEPGKILDKVTDLVIETFEQSEDEVKDGMDIAICSYETIGDYIEVQYAGANNPLWVVRTKNEMNVNGVNAVPILANADNTFFLFEVAATRQPVGKYAERKPFKNNVIQLEDGDTLYTFTDGYADQFGGAKGKKFMASNFKKLLIAIQQETMENQMIAIKKAFDEWKGGEEQIDDVCVIGIRL
jgi:serine phosphatase RsbU (regulator of sigma subunit)